MLYTKIRMALYAHNRILLLLRIQVQQHKSLSTIIAGGSNLRRRGASSPASLAPEESPANLAPPSSLSLPKEEDHVRPMGHCRLCTMQMFFVYINGNASACASRLCTSHHKGASSLGRALFPRKTFLGEGLYKHPSSSCFLFAFSDLSIPLILP